MKKLLLLLLTLMLLTPLHAPALAEDVYTVQDASAASALSTDCSYLRIRCPVPGSQMVTLTIRDAWGGLYYQRSHGQCASSFRSEDIYLRLDGGESVYHVTLQVGSDTHQFRVTRTQPRLTDSSVYACGLPLSGVTGARTNKYAVIIDVDALESSSLTVPLVSAGMEIGSVTFAVRGGSLETSARLTVDGSIDKSTVYVARDAVTARTLGTNHFTGQKTRLNRAVDLRGTPYAAVLVQLTVSYDAAGAAWWQSSDHLMQHQQQLWNLMQMTTANEAVG